MADNGMIMINKATFAPYYILNRMNGKTKTPITTKEKQAIIESQGYYKKTPNGIQLTDSNGELFAFIPKQCNGMIVTARRHPEINNKIWYSYALSSSEETRFGYPKSDNYMSYENSRHLENEAKKALEQLGFYKGTI